MPSYFVTWEIDVEADNPKEAAEEARRLQTKAGTSAVVFDVFDEDGERITVDLEED